jgi:uncharacterized protein (DUF169 family)
VNLEILVSEFVVWLDRVVNPHTRPVAVSFLKDESDAPSDALRPMESLGRPIRPCEAVGYARHEGLPSTMTREDFASDCPIGPFAFGTIQPLEDWLGGQMALHICTDSQDVAQKMVRGIPRLAAGEYGAFAFRPLEMTDQAFDILVVYANSLQTMKLIEAARWNTGNPLVPNITARAACANSIVQPFLRGEPVISIPCGGDRTWGRTQDAELIFSIPYLALEDLLAGLQGYDRAHRRSGLGEPTLVEVNYKPFAERIEPLLRAVGKRA